MFTRRSRVFRYTVAVFLVAALLNLQQILTVQGEQSEPKFMMLRLEDVGPGGQYDSEEQLGKLRAVLEYLRQQHVRCQIGVIPRWINILPDKTVYNRQIDQLDDPYIQKFVRLLQQSVAGGAVVGMHGYTHQAGVVRRADGHHESGIGNEFDVSGLPETSTPEFAGKRVEEGLRLFRTAGLRPAFWEAPHYHIAAAQEAVFRSYFGLIYENMRSSPHQPYAAYWHGRTSGPGEQVLGAVYVPTPFSFIPYNRDEKLILNQLSKKKLPSFFYHAFLEFKHLVPVVDEEGRQVMRDGLPEYRYSGKEKSNLQRLVARLKEKAYTFYSIHDYVPFTPAHSVFIGYARGSGVRIGDVNGDKQADTVTWDATGVKVTAGKFDGPRNEAQPAAVKWLDVGRRKGDQFALYDDNGDGLKDLWIARVGGEVSAYHSTGSAFVFYRTWKVNTGGDWADMYALRQSKGDWMLVGTSTENNQLFGVYMHGQEASPAPPLKWRSSTLKDMQVHDAGNGSECLWVPRKDAAAGAEIRFLPAAKKWKVGRLSLNLRDGDGEVRFGDFNGDGREDVLQWNEADGIFTVYLRGVEGEYNLLSRFGPWMKPGAKLEVADFDGSGTSDLGLAGGADGRLDLALSYQKP